MNVFKCDGCGMCDDGCIVVTTDFEREPDSCLYGELMKENAAEDRPKTNWKEMVGIDTGEEK